MLPKWVTFLPKILRHGSHFVQKILRGGSHFTKFVKKMVKSAILMWKNPYKLVRATDRIYYVTVSVYSKARNHLTTENHSFAEPLASGERLASLVFCLAFLSAFGAHPSHLRRLILALRALPSVSRTESLTKTIINGSWFAKISEKLSIQLVFEWEKSLDMGRGFRPRAAHSVKK